MSLILDTSGLLSAIDADQKLHKECAAAVSITDPPLFLSPFVLAELDYLIGSRVGERAQLALVDDVGRGAYRLEPFSEDDVNAASRMMKRYPGVGLADASIVVLANRHRCRDILTLDERHFRKFRDTRGRSFRLLPVDSR